MIRNAWLLRALASRYPVDLVTADDATADVPADFRDACTSISRFPRTPGIAGAAERAMKTFRPRASFYTSGNTVAALRRKVRTLMARPGSLAMIDLRMIEALSGTAYPFIYNAHNAEHLLLRRRAERESQPARSLLLLESLRIRGIEARAVRGARLVAACSENDRQELAALCLHDAEKVAIVPNGVDTMRYAAIAEEVGDPRTILITGSYDWRPNVIGLEWFFSEVLPALRDRMPVGGYMIRIAGRMKSDLASRLNRFPEVIAVPNPPDMLEELARSTIVAAPIVASSGTRLRILEAWAAGRPVVTTTAGALGLAYTDNRELMLADTGPAFADALVRALNDTILRKRLSEFGLRRASRYDWSRIGADFLDRTEALLERRAFALATSN